ncbi:unnamed protein product [Protopolystoma xenopodis]|uniref:Uncharacterized protein n=1 Tax=Protopolystoma xenopodis TaxID=117903 RepID=A0A3S5A6T3_9PLAT|nr:unnamed protein product [Protopolystoma xenopodis]
MILLQFTSPTGASASRETLSSVGNPHERPILADSTGPALCSSFAEPGSRPGAFRRISRAVEHSLTSELAVASTEITGTSTNAADYISFISSPGTPTATCPRTVFKSPLPTKSNVQCTSYPARASSVATVFCTSGSLHCWADLPSHSSFLPGSSSRQSFNPVDQTELAIIPETPETPTTPKAELSLSGPLSTAFLPEAIPTIWPVVATSMVSKCEIETCMLKTHSIQPFHFRSDESNLSEAHLSRNVCSLSHGTDRIPITSISLAQRPNSISYSASMILPVELSSGLTKTGKTSTSAQTNWPMMACLTSSLETDHLASQDETDMVVSALPNSCPLCMCEIVTGDPKQPVVRCSTTQTTSCFAQFHSECRNLCEYMTYHFILPSFQLKNLPRKGSAGPND